MITITVADLARDVEKYLQAVEQGESIEIHRDDKPVAIISPAAKRGREFLRRITPLSIDGLSLAKEVLADRDESR